MAKPAEEKGFDRPFELGQIFEQCNDKAWSQKLSAKWYLQLARQGYRRAQHRLGRMYAEGYGVEQNYIKAYAWCKISATQNSPRALIQLEDIESKMTAEQIQLARKLARQYYDTYVAPFAS